MRMHLAPAPRLEGIVSGGLVVAGLALLALARFFPFGSLPPLCVFKHLTGLPCLTCGMTRSWVAVMHGELAQALAWNPAGAALCALTLLGTVYLLARAVGAPAVRLDASRREGRALAIGVVVVVIVNWLYVLASGRV